MARSKAFEISGETRYRSKSADNADTSNSTSTPEIASSAPMIIPGRGPASAEKGQKHYPQFFTPREEARAQRRAQRMKKSMEIISKKVLESAQKEIIARAQDLNEQAKGLGISQIELSLPQNRDELRSCKHTLDLFEDEIKTTSIEKSLSATGESDGYSSSEEGYCPDPLFMLDEELSESQDPPTLAGF